MFGNSDYKAVFAGTSGTVLQWYDFAIFGYFAPIIATTYFPSDNPSASLLSVFGVFAVGYLLAPLGALFLGYIGDNYGRKQALTISILMMAIPTALMSLIPGYQTIGIAAPILVTVMRMLQGLVAHSEFTGSAIFLVEHAKPENRAFYSCLSSCAYSLGCILAGFSAAFFTASFMPLWGWRLGFALALIAGGIIFFLRVKVSETPEFKSIKESEKEKYPVFVALKEMPLTMLGVMGLTWLGSVITFGTYVFLGTYLHSYFNLPLSQTSLIITFALIVDGLLEPFVARFADKKGYLPVIITGISLMMLFSIPIFYLLSLGEIISITLAMVFMSVLIAIIYAPLNAYMVALFPKQYRYSGFSFAFTLSVSLFGGTTPLVMMWLVEKTDNFIAPAWYYVWAGVIGLVSLWICERKPLSDSQGSVLAQN